MGRQRVDVGDLLVVLSPQLPPATSIPWPSAESPQEVWVSRDVWDALHTICQMEIATLKARQRPYFLDNEEDDNEFDA